MITTEQLVVGYKEPLGSAIDIQFDAGSFHVILGPNGSGKSTLFKTILGLIKPISGQIRIDGESLESLHQIDRARTFAYVPQSQQQVFPYTVAEMVLMGRTTHIKPFASPGQNDFLSVDSALDTLGIGGLKDLEFTKLSGGQRQLTVIARALAQNARVIILDEPTSSLDFGNEVRVLDEISKLARQGWTIILSTHNPTHALQLADSVTTIKNGSVMAHGSPRSILTSDHLSELYQSEIAVIEVDGVHTCVATNLMRPMGRH